MDVLILTFEAPLMSFGGVMVDARGPTEDHPGLAMLVGLLGNALGYDHGDADQLERLQERLRFASRCDRPGELLRDYHTVDLGDRGGPHDATRGAPYTAGSTAPNLAHGGWTTRGAREDRDGADARLGTHIRDRHYHADRIQTVALTLDPSDEEPALAACEAALRRPARPLFIGRKTCLPTRPIFRGRIEAASLRAALETWPRHRRSLDQDDDDREYPGPLVAWWPAQESGSGEHPHAELPMVDRRDWRNQLVAGRRLVHQGLVEPPATEEDQS